MATIDCIKTIELPISEFKGGLLGVLEGPLVPHLISRVFFVNSSEGDIRGQHGHKACWQTLICLKGVIQLEMIDSNGDSLTEVLDSSRRAVAIPPGIWAKQKSVEMENILVVLASDVYDPDDYFYDKPTQKYP
jgi:UDP-2-acetamido-3-amino-2,3-dideoxy-glucuronate N-acetyltransferase